MIIFIVNMYLYRYPNVPLVTINHPLLVLNSLFLNFLAVSITLYVYIDVTLLGFAQQLLLLSH